MRMKIARKQIRYRIFTYGYWRGVVRVNHEKTKPIQFESIAQMKQFESGYKIGDRIIYYSIR